MLVQNTRGKKSTSINAPKVKRVSLTIPGQSLKPAELLKRHLAGTLPDIDLKHRYEFHYDENGNQVAEPLPLEMSEIYKLSVAIRKRQYEEAIEQRKKRAEKHKEEIISEYLKKNPPPSAKDKQAPPSDSGGTASASPEGATAL